jgi:hypothetical protein
MKRKSRFLGLSSGNPAAQEYHDTEAKVFSICARAGVSCIGIQHGFGIAPDFVYFSQPLQL